MPKPLNCCFPGTPCTEHRVLIDGLSDKHNALAAVVAANAESARAKIEQVEEATRSRDADINELKTNVVLEKERREAADSSLAADIERERANREQAIELVRIDFNFSDLLISCNLCIEVASIGFHSCFNHFLSNSVYRN